jgi:hypothetical protein
MKQAQKEAEEFEAALKKQKEDDKKQKDASLKAQAESLKEAEEAQKEAREAASAERSKQADKQKAYLAQQMTARIAQFEDMYTNTWSDGLPGLSLFSLSGDFNHETEDELIKHLLRNKLVADIEEYKMDTTLKFTFTHEGHMESHTNPEQVRFNGLVYDDKIEEMSKDITKHFFNNHTRIGKLPDFDLTTVPIATGSKQYLDWALTERTKPWKNIHKQSRERADFE